MEEIHQISESRLGYLVKIPDWLFTKNVFYDEEHWESVHNISILPWQRLDISQSLPLTERVFVTIKDFSIDFWHPIPFYFRQAMAGMGVLVRVANECLFGGDKSDVRILIDCPNRQLIPYFSK